MSKTATIHAQQRWEYETLYKKSNSFLNRELNELGQEGWELVSVNYARGKKEEMYWFAFLKRPASSHSTHKTMEDAKPARHNPAPSPTGDFCPIPTAEPAVPEAKKETSDESLNGFNLEGDVFSIPEESDDSE